jgi:hypothetical protein
MTTYNLKHGEKHFTLTGWQLYYLVSALEALIDGKYQLTPQEIQHANQMLAKYETMLGLEVVEPLDI